LTKARWLQARTAELLPVTYFHNVFTLPHELNPIILCNKKVIYNLLFKSASRTLLQFGKNPDNGLGGQLGFNAILHTWDQRLLDHFHLHCAIPGGVLSFDHTQWVSSREDFLFPVGPLSEVFRGKFTDYLKKAFQEGKLNFPGNAEEFATPQRFSQLLNQLWTKKWVVYSEEPFGGPQQVLDYLGRYTHRVAISNHRIVNVEQGEVSFKYRDRKDSAKVKIMTLEADEFIRRFLLHVLPDDFMRIRYFGFLANRCKREKLPICRRLLGLPPRLPAAAKKNPVELMLELTSIDITQCPSCRKGTMKIIAEIPKYSEVFLDNLLHQPQINDSS